MLSFELIQSEKKKPPEELEVHLDNEGLQALIAQLQLLQRNGRTEHVHLMAESWGGHHLDELPQGATGIPLRHVKIMFWSRD